MLVFLVEEKKRITAAQRDHHMPLTARGTHFQATGELHVLEPFTQKEAGKQRWSGSNWLEDINTNTLLCCPQHEMGSLFSLPNDENNFDDNLALFEYPITNYPIPITSPLIYKERDGFPLPYILSLPLVAERLGAGNCHGYLYLLRAVRNFDWT